MYTKDDVNRISKLLLKNKETIAVAESVTSGHLQSVFSLADNATLIFQGGITTYNLGQKSRHLHVNPILAEGCNSVSDEIAKEMAIHVIELFSSDWGIAITGYAAPVPELNVLKPYAWCSIAHRSKTVITKKLNTAARSGKSTQEYYVVEAMKLFRKALIKK